MSSDSAVERLFREARSESGLTLIELVVAVLIVGLLAAVAVAAFLSTRISAGDSSAKSLMQAAQQTAVTYGLTTSGYTGMTPAALNAAERSINITANGKAVLAAAAPTLTGGYTLAVVSSTANTFNVTSANGVVTRTCVVATGNGNTTTNTGGGCRAGTW